MSESIDDPAPPTDADDLTSGSPVGPRGAPVDRRELELEVPMGHRVHLPTRGTTFVRELDGPEGAPTVLLLHGLMATSGLSWSTSFGPLGEDFHVLAPDLRGHGRGIHSRRRFSIDDCADDSAVLVDLLGAGPCIVVGIGLGASVALTLWRRHRRNVEALCLVGTGAEFDRIGTQRMIGAMSVDLGMAVSRSAGVLGIVPNLLAEQFIAPAHTARAQTLRKWARQEMRRHSTRAMVEGAVAAARFRSASWIRDVDVPATVVVTAEDSIVAPEAQRRLAAAVPGADVVEYPGGSRACLEPEFGLVIADVCRSLRDRIGR